MYDSIIVGAGAVGLVAAQKLASLGQRVALVELGQDSTRPVLSGDSVEFTASEHAGATRGWGAGLGGTTRLWGGQLWAWEAYEFEARPHVETTAWPYGRSDLEPAYQEFLRMLGAGPAVSRGALQSDDALSSEATRSSVFYDKASVWLPWRKRNFYRVLGTDLDSSPRVNVFGGARADAVEIGDSRIRLRVSTDTGWSDIEGHSLLLCSGTLGNIGLLQRWGLSTSPWLGRGFMDHVSATYQTFVIEDPVRFALAAGSWYDGSTLRTPKLVLHPSYARSDSLLNACAHWDIDLPPDHPLAAVRAALRGRQSGAAMPAGDALRAMAKTPGAMASAAYLVGGFRRRPVPKGAQVRLQIEVEQPPRFESAVEWTSERRSDAELEMNWFVGAEEKRTFSEFGRAIAAAIDIETLGIRPTGPPTLEAPFNDTYHMMGGVRISEDASEGVVDRSCRLHEFPNVRVLGAGAFPSGGVANPTMTSAALTLRVLQDVT